MAAVWQINQADLGGAESFLFEVMGQPANGARACRSNRHQDRRVHALTFHQAGDLAGSAFVLPPAARFRGRCNGNRPPSR